MKYPYALLAGLLGALVMALPAAAAEKIVMGWIEKVRLYPGNFVVDAKLDTGAEYCSLDATNITKFNRDGQEWVRFEVNDHHGKDHHGAPPVAPGHHQAAFRQVPEAAGDPAAGLRRQRLQGNRSQSGGSHRVSIPHAHRPEVYGRRLIIDPAAKHTVEPTCQEQPP